MSDDKRLERIEGKVDKIMDHVSSIDATIAGQSGDIRHHIKRTDELQAIVVRVDKHVTIVNGLAKILTAGGVLGALILKLLGKI